MTDQNQETGISIRWGIPMLDMGYTDIPNIILRYYSQAGATRQEMLAVIHLSSYSYGSNPRPGLERIAREMGYKTVESVSRLVASLQEKKLLQITHRSGKTSIYNFYKLSMACIAAANAEKQPPENLQGVENLQGLPPENLQGDPPQKSGGKSNIKKESLKTTGEGKKQKKARDEKLDHAAVVMYRDKAHRTPAEPVRALIIEKVGDNPQDIDRWGEVVLKYVASGYNPGNVNNMLTIFAIGWDTWKNGSANGSTPKTGVVETQDLEPPPWLDKRILEVWANVPPVTKTYLIKNKTKQPKVIEFLKSKEIIK